jgi:predicted dehydrogenase
MKAALIGAGQIARQHLACLKELPGVEVAAVCDLSAATAEAAAERYGVASWFTDSNAMLAQVRPDVVHVTTPPASHFVLASSALDAGAHVFVEKPATVTFDEVVALAERSRSQGRGLVEDYNYIYNGATRRILDLIKSGEFGSVVHVEVFVTLDILGKGSPFADPNAPHPVLALPGGAIADFLTHLASLAHAFIGPHRAAYPVWSKRAGSPLPFDEFHAVVEAARGTASLGFSARVQPDAFWLRVYGTKMQAVANLFETRLTLDRLRGGPRPLRPFWNSLAEAGRVGASAFGGLARKLSGGPGSYEGLWELLGRTYRAFQAGEPPPIDAQRVVEVNALVEAIRPRRESVS